RGRSVTAMVTEPRYCPHRGFGRLPVSGSAFARRGVAAALGAGAVIRTGVTALDWAGPSPGDPHLGPLALETVSPSGPETITAKAVVLATGGRERPRSARLVAGTRPAGVFTGGELQQTVHLHRQTVGSRAVVIGAEQVGFAAVDTLSGAGVDVTAMVTERPRDGVAMLRRLNSRLRQGVPLLTDTSVTELLGHGRLTGVRLRHRDGRTTTLPCDTIVFTGNFVPDHELARRGGLDLDPQTHGPAVDAAFRTSRRGVFAVGGLLHAGASAAVAAREGRRAAHHVRAHLSADSV
ncbi:FAD-dependent oxidoreductase, partial [Streptomyces sp. HC44]